MIDDDEDEAMNAYSDSDEDYRENIYLAGDPTNWLKDKMFISNNFKIACKREVITALKYFLENIPVFMHRVRAKNEITKMLKEHIKAAEDEIVKMKFNTGKENELFVDSKYTVGQWLKDKNHDILE